MTKFSKLFSKFITTKEACDRFNLSDGYFRYLITHGKVSANRVGRTWLMDLDSLKKFLSTERKPGPKTSNFKR